jgi:RNA polymerase sigma-70 factor (ECF subfamily)
MAVLDDGELLRDASAGRTDAVRALLDATGPVLYGFVLARVGGQRAVAEDVVQETYLEAMRSAHTFRGDSALTTWLCGIARHRLMRHYESERRQEAARNELAMLPFSGDQLEAVERSDAVMLALGRLPSTQRQALVLKYLDGLSVEEVAAALGRDRVQVQSLLQRGREGLRRQLGTSMEDFGDG